MKPRTRMAATAAAALCLAGAVTGCSSSSSGSGAQITLTIAEWTNPGAVQVTQEVDAEFEQQHPGVTVKLQDAPTANGAWSTLANSLLQSKSVDVLAQFAPTQASFAPSYTGIKAGGPAALIEAGEMTDLKNEPFMKDYDTAAQSAAVGYNGGIYGVMAAEYESAGAVWYKKDLLAKYHLSVPTTFQEFLADCAALKKDGITPIFLSGKVGMQGGVWQGIENQLLMQGKAADQSTTVSNDRATAFWKGTQSWTDQVYQETSTRYAQVMQYVEPSAAGVAQQTAPGVWAAQANDYPFLIDGSWDGLTIKQANANLNFGIFAFPGTDDASANRVALKPDLTWMVPTSTAHKDLAMQWLSLFSQASNYQKWLTATGSVSTEPAVSSTGLSWMDWLDSHMSTSFEAITNPWIPNGAPDAAAGPDLYTMTPFGSTSISASLSASAAAYTKSVKK